MRNKILALVFFFFFVISTFACASYKESCDIKLNSSGVIKKTVNSKLLNNEWEQINEDGFGDASNVGTRGMTSFKGYLCVGLTNLNISSGEINGCELWCYNGSEWFQSVGNSQDALLSSGFGNSSNAECSILIEFNNKLYAGTANNEGLQLWRTDDPVEGAWEQVIDNGFGDVSNMGAWSAKIFNDYLYIGTANFPKGCEIWRTANGEEWETVVGGTSITPGGFGEILNDYVWCIEVYNNTLYVGTHNMRGGEIWKTKNGLTWECLVGPAGERPRGFQLLDLNYGIRNLKVFNGELYAGTAAMPAVTVRVKIGGLLLKPRERTIFWSPEIGFHIWRYNESKNNKWERVVGGFFGDNSLRNGFGDNHNTYAWTMDIFKDELYVGSYNTKRSYFSIALMELIKNISSLKDIMIYVGSDLVTKDSDGCEIWKTGNGNQWVQVVGNESEGPANGFGDKFNLGTRSITIYSINNEDALIIGTINSASGCEIWKYQ